MTRDPSQPAGLSAPDPFDDLLARCLERFEAEGNTGLEAMCAEHPQHAARLRQQVGQLLQMGLLDAPGGAERAEFPERLGPFRLRAQLGGGGMGVVFLAWQEDLGREVALKLIRPDQLYFPGMRERFRREVEAIARMDHPGVVPVYSVGEENGIPYFAMQRVRGASLAQLLDRLRGRTASRLKGRDLAQALIAVMKLEPAEQDAVLRVFAGSYEERCLHIARQVADALQHAHDVGVLHRDVKPSNVMISPDGRAQLLDFGLAASAGADALTRSGTPLGSLYYMSPEQGRGAIRDVDRRSDVYSLAVTLYEMLTLGPPYTGESAHDVLARIHAGSPAGLRQRNAALSWECETVILKAMDRDPPRRYPTAAALSRDLDNVLEHRPITARPAGPLLRLRRVARRHPSLAVAVLIGLPVITLGPLVLLLQERAARRAIDEKREVADRNFGRALDAVDAMLSEVAEVDLRHVPQMEGVRRALIDKALTFYQGFLAERRDDDDVRRRTVRVLIRCGTLHDLLGDYPQAERSYRNGLKLLEELRASAGASEFTAVQTAVSLRSLAAIQRDHGAIEDALASVRGALAALDAWRATAELSNAAEGERAEAHAALGTMLLQRSLPDAERAYRDAVPILERLCQGEPTVTLHQSRLAIAYKSLGVARDWSGDLPGAAELYRKSVTLFERLLASDPKSSDYRYNVAVCLLNLGSIEFDTGHEEAGDIALRRSIDLLRGLVADFPGVIDYRRDLGKTLFNYGYYLARGTGRDDEVRRIQADAIAVARQLMAEQPAAREPIADLALGLDGVCQFEQNRGQLDAALRAGEQALELRRVEVARYPDSPDAHRTLGAILHNVALVHKDRGQPAASVPLLEEAIREQERALELLPGHASSNRFLRFHLYAVAEARLLTGDVDGGLRDAEALIARAADRAPALRGAAGLHALAAACLESSAKPDAGRIAALRERALADLREAIASGYSDLDTLLTDADYAPLRGLPGFEAAIAPLRAQQQAKAPGGA